MAHFGRKVAGGLLALAVLGVPASRAQAVNLLSNGDFELGSFAGWNVAVEPGSSGNFFISTPGVPTPGDTPSVQFDTQANTLPGGGGSFYAVSTPVTGSTIGAGAHALYHTFTVPTGTLTRVKLSFQMFVNDYNVFGSAVAPSAPPNDLFSYFDPLGDPNQFTRVDLLRDGAPVWSTDPADLMRTFYQGIDFEFRQPVPYKQYPRSGQTPDEIPLYDITPLVVPGGTYTLRFGDVSNVAPIATGVDNVVVDYIGTGVVAVPEPGTLALAALGFLSVGLAAFRCRQR